MYRQDTDELIADIREAFLELGVLQIKGQKETYNIIWKKNIVESYDPLYKQVDSPEFEDFKMFGLSLNQVSRDEMEKEGLDYKKLSKTYIDGSQFSQYEFVPKLSDRIEHRGILYDLVKIKPISIADTEILYVIYFAESTLIAQSDERQKEVEPFFEMNNADRDDITYYPASVMLKKRNLYEVRNYNKLLFRINNEASITITLDEGDYLFSEFYIYLKSKVETAFSSNLLINMRENNIYIETKEEGDNAVFDIIYIDMNAYLVLGIEVGKYRGKTVIAEIE